MLLKVLKITFLLLFFAGCEKDNKNKNVYTKNFLNINKILLLNNITHL